MKSITAAKSNPCVRIESVFLSEFLGNTGTHGVQKAVGIGNTSIDYGESVGIGVAKDFFSDIHLVRAFHRWVDLMSGRNPIGRRLARRFSCGHTCANDPHGCLSFVRRGNAAASHKKIFDILRAKTSEANSA
jgi:hypothetical protein